MGRRRFVDVQACFLFDELHRSALADHFWAGSKKERYWIRRSASKLVRAP